jgi:hypothetical protein
MPGQQLVPGEQLDGELDQLKLTLILRERPQWQVGQPGVEPQNVADSHRIHKPTHRRLGSRPTEQFGLRPHHSHIGAGKSPPSTSFRL